MKAKNMCSLLKYAIYKVKYKSQKLKVSFLTNSFQNNNQ